MGENHDLLELLRGAFAEGEQFDRDMRADGWTLTRCFCLRAFLELSASGTPEGSNFLVWGGQLFRGGMLQHKLHPDMAIKAMPYDDVWLPPVWEVVNELWVEVVRLALERPGEFRAAMQSIEAAELAINSYGDGD